MLRQLLCACSQSKQHKRCAFSCVAVFPWLDQGRLSGSLAWRVARSEVGGETSTPSVLGATPFTHSSGLAAQAVSSGWQDLLQLPAAAAFVASFGEHVVTMTTDHRFQFTSIKALRARAAVARASSAAQRSGAGAGAGAGVGAGAGAGAGGGTGVGAGVSWRPFRVQTPDGSVWPPPPRRVVAMTATHSPLRVFAVDDEGAVWACQPRPSAPAAAADAATAAAVKAEEKAHGRVWHAYRLGTTGRPHVRAVGVCNGSLVVTACGEDGSSKRDEALSLYVLQVDVSKAGAGPLPQVIEPRHWRRVSEASDVRSFQPACLFARVWWSETVYRAVFPSMHPIAARVASVVLLLFFSLCI